MRESLPAEAAHERQLAMEPLLSLEGSVFARALRDAVEADIATVHPLFIAVQNGALPSLVNAVGLLAQALLPVAVARADVSPTLFVRLAAPDTTTPSFEQLTASAMASRGCGPLPAALRRLMQIAPVTSIQPRRREGVLIIAQQSRDRCVRLSRSERPGSALGGVAALDWNWPPVAARLRAGLARHAQLRPAHTAAFEIQPNQAETLAMLESLVAAQAIDLPHRRALVFGAAQALADRALLWDAILDAAL